MCSFKHCRNSGRCFLARVSPCPNKPEKVDKQVAALEFQYEGFLDPNKLLSELGFAAKAPVANKAKPRSTAKKRRKAA